MPSPLARSEGGGEGLTFLFLHNSLILAWTLLFKLEPCALSLAPLPLPLCPWPLGVGPCSPFSLLHNPDSLNRWQISLQPFFQEDEVYI